MQRRTNNSPRTRRGRNRSQAGVFLAVFAAAAALYTSGCESDGFDTRRENSDRISANRTSGSQVNWVQYQTSVTKMKAPEYLAIAENPLVTSVNIASPDALASTEDALVQKKVKPAPYLDLPDPLLGHFKSNMDHQADVLLQESRLPAGTKADSENAPLFGATTPHLTDDSGQSTESGADAVTKDMLQHLKARKQIFGHDADNLGLDFDESARVARIVAEKKRQLKLRAERAANDGLLDPDQDAANGSDRGQSEATGAVRPY